MNELPNVVIVMARCNESKNNFGIRFEEKIRGQWVADWSFMIKETAASKEGYDKGEITGNFTFDEAYRGCPYCHTISFFKCGCGKVSCWNSNQHLVTCPWCRHTGEIAGEIETLGAGTDR